MYICQKTIFRCSFGIDSPLLAVSVLGLRSALNKTFLTQFAMAIAMVSVFFLVFPILFSQSRLDLDIPITFNTAECLIRVARFALPPSLVSNDQNHPAASRL